MILFPFLKNNAEPPWGKWETFCKRSYLVRRPGSAQNNTISCFEYFIRALHGILETLKEEFFIPSVESGFNNSISCLTDSIFCCAFQNNDDLLTMMSFGGRSKTDSFAWVLMQVYYQIEIPSPVSHSKSGKKTGFEWICGLLSWNSISCCICQHRKTTGYGHFYGLYQFSCGTGNGISIW